MAKFSGFPSKTSYVPLPAMFLSALLPEIDDIRELKVTLYVISALYQKRGFPRFVTRDELLGNLSLRKSLRESGNEDRTLTGILDAMVKRGTVIRVKEYDVYLLNTEQDRETAEKIKNGEIPLPVVKKESSKAEIEKADSGESPDIFTLYEENIGMLTPIIADFLKEAEKLYPRGWIEDAVKEAVSLNKRNWRYIARILERWENEGKSDGTYRRHSEKKPDPDKYIRGKYGHMVQR